MALALLAFPLLARTAIGISLADVPPAVASAAPLPAAPDARFALALYCNPTCDDAVIDQLEAALAAIPDSSGFDEVATQPARMMGIAGTEFGIPDADYIAQFGVDVNDPERLAKSEEVLLAWFVAPRGQAVETFATAHAAFAQAAVEAAGWVEDLDTQSIYGSKAWAGRDPRGPLTDWFVVDAVPTSPDDPDSPLRLVTRGLRRYGDTDLVVPDVPVDSAGDVSFVLNSVAETIHRSATLQPTFGVDSDTVRGTVTLAAIDALDDDPEPPLLRVSFEGDILKPDGEASPAEPAAAPPQPVAAVAAPTAPAPVPAPALAPTAPVVSDVAPLPAAPRSLAEAQGQARARLDSVVRAAWDKGLPDGAAVAVSAPFETAKGGTEYIWVELRDWKGGQMSGVLVNEPYDVPGLHAGDVVSVQQDEVFDYIWKRGDGTREGNSTAPFLRP